MVILFVKKLVKSLAKSLTESLSLKWFLLVLP